MYEGIARKDNRTFLYMYEKYQGQILRMVEKNSGNADDALDLFQEGMIALWTNIQQGKFQLKENARISTYLFALCRNLWISKLRKRKVIHSISRVSYQEVAAEVEEMEEQYTRIQILEQHVSKLGDTCKQLLHLFYHQKASLKEIASQLKLTEKTAKNNKYRCMQRLRSMYHTEKRNT
jgi:RNA polymerase sigma factor (sigma-70 family)